MVNGPLKLVARITELTGTCDQAKYVYFSVFFADGITLLHT